jgi:integral membrane protein
VPSALTRYRVMAYTTGVVLAASCLAVGFWPWPQNETLTGYLWTAHGFLYMVYLVAVFLLAMKARWSILKTLLVMAAGTIPLMSFVAERRITRAEQAAVEPASL